MPPGRLWIFCETDPQNDTSSSWAPREIPSTAFCVGGVSLQGAGAQIWGQAATPFVQHGQRSICFWPSIFRRENAPAEAATPE